MTDRKQIINSLNDSIANQHCGFIDGVGDVYAVSGETINSVLALLKMQKPIPVKYKTNPYSGLPISCCPKCDIAIDRFIRHQSAYQTNFCPICGQAVKWE